MTANYKQPEVFNKRVRFYDGQFLQDQDFVDEQKYHIDRQRRHQHILHVSGIATGLDVTANNNKVTVSPGTAVDRDGRQIVLEEEPKDQPTVTGECWLYIAYHQVPDEKQASSQGIQDNTRWVETPFLFISKEPIGENDPYDVSKLDWKEPPDPKWEMYLEKWPPPPVLLAKLTVDGAGKVQVDQDVRRYSGVLLPDGGADREAWPTLRAGAPGRVDLTGDLTVTGNVGIGTTESGNKRLRVEGGDTYLGGELTVTGASKLNNELTVTGNVGIGTTDPEATLDVRGTLKAEVTMVGLAFNPKEEGYVEIPEMNPNYDDGFTVEAWVCYHSFRSWSRIIDFGNGARADNIVFSNQGTTNDLAFQVYAVDAASIITAPGELETDTWMHLAATVDGEGNATLYKNGQQLVTFTVHVPANLSRAKNYIGRSNWDHDDYFDGKIAEVRIWNCARTAADINNYMNSKLSGSEGGLVGYWPCDEGTGEKVKDLTPNDNRGTIRAARWFTEEIPAIAVARNGHVGIGTTSPQAKLDVNGDLRVSGPFSAPSSLGTYFDKVEKWQNSTDSDEWTLLTKREITLSARTHVLVLGHCHGITGDYRTALDLGIFIDGYDLPMGKTGHGLAISHATTWVPIVAVTAAVLEKGDHTIEFKFRARGGEWWVSCSGVSMTTMVLGSV